jgi:hypothetical protein
VEEDPEEVDLLLPQRIQSAYKDNEFKELACILLPLLWSRDPNHQVFQWEHCLRHFSIRYHIGKFDSLDVLKEKLSKICLEKEGDYVFQREALAREILDREPQNVEALEVSSSSCDPKNIGVGKGLFCYLPSLETLADLQKNDAMVDLVQLVGGFCCLLDSSSFASNVLLCGPEFGETVVNRDNWDEGEANFCLSDWANDWVEWVRAQAPPKGHVIFPSITSARDHIVVFRINLDQSIVHVYDSFFKYEVEDHIQCKLVAKWCSMFFKSKFSCCKEIVMQQVPSSNDCSVFACRFVEALVKEPTSKDCCQFLKPKENQKCVASKDRQNWGLQQRQQIANMFT